MERWEKVAILTLNRPERLNTLNGELQDVINKTCQEIRNDVDVWAVVFTGAGRGFCSGADLSGARESGDQQPSRQEELHKRSPAR